jgi:phospholipid-binding lipoprotein MlaA
MQPRLVLALFVALVWALCPVTGARAGSEEPAPSAPASDDTSLADLEQAEAGLAEYDPWLGFNEKTFAFNHGLDRRVIKPVATAYDTVVPNLAQRAVRNFFENIGSFRRILNTALQGRFDDMGQEFGRFFINTTFGVGGLIDAAPSFGVRPRTVADTGQTFGVWGLGPGPYLVIPVLPPLTVRDAFGYGIDSLLDPMVWVFPFTTLLGITAERTVNERSLNLELFENVEETVFDLYSAVRNGYLQRRAKAVELGRQGSVFRRERLILSGDEKGQ